jgi:basic amino acid/polyamine antiporter, APA family
MSSDLQPKSLERRLGLLAVVASGLGVTIGAGIYVLIGAAAGRAGNAIWVSFVLAAVIASFTALSYAKLIRLRPKNAPEFQFVTMAFNRRTGFLAGWLTLWSMIISAAVVSLGFAGYLSNLFDVPVVFGALGLLVVATAITLSGMKQSVALLIALTIPTVFGLIAVIIVGMPHVGDFNLFEVPSGFSGVANAAALVFFAYLGFETMANLAEEMKHPEKDLSRAMLFVLAIGALLYVLVSVAVISVLGWLDLSQSAAPMADVASRTIGSNASGAISLISLAATGSTGLFLIMASSRAVWAMSCAGVLPLPFCSISRSKTPWIAILGVGILAGLFVFIKNVETVAQVTNIAVLLAFAGVNAAAIKLIDKIEPNKKHTLPSRLLPILGLLSSIWLALNTGMTAIVFGFVLIISGLVYYRIVLSKSDGPGG